MTSPSCQSPTSRRSTPDEARDAPTLVSDFHQRATRRGRRRGRPWCGGRHRRRTARRARSPTPCVTPSTSTVGPDRPFAREREIRDLHADGRESARRPRATARARPPVPRSWRRPRPAPRPASSRRSPSARARRAARGVDRARRRTRRAPSRAKPGASCPAMNDCGPVARSSGITGLLSRRGSTANVIVASPIAAPCPRARSTDDHHRRTAGRAARGRSRRPLSSRRSAAPKSCRSRSAVAIQPGAAAYAASPPPIASTSVARMPARTRP